MILSPSHSRDIQKTLKRVSKFGKNSPSTCTNLSETGKKSLMQLWNQMMVWDMCEASTLLKVEFADNTNWIKALFMSLQQNQMKQILIKKKKLQLENEASH